MPKIDPNALRLGIQEIRRDYCPRSAMDCTIRYMITKETVDNCRESRRILTDIQHKLGAIYDVISPILGPDRTRPFIRNLQDVCDYYIKKACVEERKIYLLAERCRGPMRRIGRKLERQRVADKTTAMIAGKINAEWQKLCKAIGLYKENPDRARGEYYLPIAQVADTLAYQVKHLAGSNGFMKSPH